MPPPQKKYICGFCARAFTRSEHKQRHERSHTNEKPFHCLYCTSAFVRRDLLQRHCRTVHNIRLVSRSHYKEERLSDQPSPEKKTLPHLVAVPLSKEYDQNDVKLPPLAIAPAGATAENALSPEILKQEQENDSSHIMASAKALLQLAPSKNGASYPLPLARLPPVAPGAAFPDSEVSPRFGARVGSVDKLESGSASGSPVIGDLASFVSNEDNEASRLSVTSPLDLVQLLSISKNLEKMYDAEDLQYPVNDLFLVGYSVLAHEPYSVFTEVRRDLVEYLHSYSANSPLSDFKVGLVYTILAVGALTVPGNGYNGEEVATSFINKAWNILVDRLIPKHTSLIFQSEILKNLYVLTYTYLRFFNNDLMLSYLEDSSHIILQNLAAAQNNMSEEIVLMNMDLFWSIYVLVSKYKINEAPPKFYSWFLAQNVLRKPDTTLQKLMEGFLKSVHKLEDPFLNEIVVCTLSNELGNLFFNRSLWIYELRNSLHNAVILVNKSVKKWALLVSTYNAIFDIFHKKLIINAPSKFKDLLDNYVFQISAPYHWSLLLTTLREFNFAFNFDRFMKENLQSLFEKFGNAILEFFATSDNLVIGSQIPASDINNNLGIVSFPLIFNYNLLKLNHVSPPVDVSNLSLVDLSNLNNLVLGWYITVVKILINLFSNNSPAEIQRVIGENCVLQCLMYMVNDKELENATGSPEFYLLLFNELTKICDTWLNFFNKNSHLTNFRYNVNRFLNDLFVLALNNDSFYIGDLYVTNDSILTRNRRSKSISSIDTSLNSLKGSITRGSISTAPPVFSQAPLPTIPNAGKNTSSNYVLMNRTDSMTSSPLNAERLSQTSTSLSPSNSLPPLQSVSKYQFNGGNGKNSGAMFFSQPMDTSTKTLILPPIHAQTTQSEKSPMSNFKRVVE